MLLIGCSEGGTSIEDLAEKYPEKIVRIPVDIREGITDEQARQATAQHQLCRELASVHPPHLMATLLTRGLQCAGTADGGGAAGAERPSSGC